MIGVSSLLSLMSRLSMLMQRRTDVAYSYFPVSSLLNNLFLDWGVLGSQNSPLLLPCASVMYILDGNATDKE